ncbi:molybdopterin-dependent oxidoreductase [Desulfotignum balticum]|uniref:molybdopterin-dependent oxidoreductase n=1 Tax=Desulfotignum balticum TaxID=115781 RepID=UPI00041DE202|nr:molybdopterin cofactor-binding domain-containing protein [Desulfotignum balticum]
MKIVNLRVNGKPVQVIADDTLVLLDLLRDTLGLAGTKQSCDRKGQCGACMVIVNGKAVLSCLTRVEKLGGADVITVEGLGTPDNPHLIQQAFLLAGAIQCGFCTPGMIMAAKALLDQTLTPTPEEIKHALRRNLCRCTGYTKIIEAVQLAARFLRGDTTPEQVAPGAGSGLMGVNHPRPSAMAKACGTAAFTADIRIPGALELAALRSPHAHADILSIDVSKALACPGVAGVMTAKDIQGTNRLKYMVPDRPVLCEDRVRYIGDPVAVVAAATRQQALDALAEIDITYTLLPVLSDPMEALTSDAVQIHDQWPNLCFTQPQIKGDAKKALEGSHAVIQARFKTQTNHQAPLEPEACAAFMEGSGEEKQLVVIGRSINIHHHLGMLQEAVGWENMRYVEAFSGGQFGIKLEITSEGIAAAAALHFRQPVRYIPGLEESMQMSSKRHSFQMNVTLGADAAHRLTGLDMDMVVDNGAYHSNGNVIVNRALLMLSGSYHIPDVHCLSRLVYTNNPWGSAARGAGPPQAHFALECAMDMLAAKLGIDPLRFRQLNSLVPGQTKSTGQAVDQWPFPELCDAIRPNYELAIREATAFAHDTLIRGVGLAAGAFGIGGPGDSAIAAVELDSDGGITIYAAAADPGEGTDSMLTQLAARHMHLPLDKIRLVTRDTDLTTATGPAAGSRLTFMVGGALVEAVNALKNAMAEVGAKTAGDLKKAGKPVRYIGRKKSAHAGTLDEKTGQGPSFDSQVHAIQLAEIEVDTRTGGIRIIRMTTACDAGVLIHPQNVEGQLHGGMDMGAGFALREQYIAGQTKDWATFRFPSMKTAFDMETILLQTPRTRGPAGAVGVGEMTMVPTAPAIINALYNACGIWVTDLPATPEKVKAKLAEKGK